MGFTKPIEQYLFSDLLIKIQVFMYLKDIIREAYTMEVVSCQHSWTTMKMMQTL